MFGWMIVFALIVIAGALRLMAGHDGSAPAAFASAVFSLLLVIAVAARATRGRAW